MLHGTGHSSSHVASNVTACGCAAMLMSSPGASASHTTRDPQGQPVQEGLNRVCTHHPCVPTPRCAGGSDSNKGPRVACGTNMTTTTSRARYSNQCGEAVACRWRRPSAVDVRFYRRCPILPCGVCLAS
jgi:hypothetical protein